MKILQYQILLLFGNHNIHIDHACYGLEVGGGVLASVCCKGVCHCIQVCESVPILIILSEMGSHPVNAASRQTLNIGTLSVQELFFQLIGWLGVELGVSLVGMVYFMG